jgi:hypothetical protein
MKLLLIMALAFLVYGCPQSDQTAYEPSPAPDSQWTQTIQPIVYNDCGPCHDGVQQPAFTSGAQFKASGAKDKLQNNLMPPPPKTIPAADKATLLSYLSS